MLAVSCGPLVLSGMVRGNNFWRQAALRLGLSGARNGHREIDKPRPGPKSESGRPQHAIDRA